MKVKIGNKIHDAEEEPIMIIFNSEEEKAGIAVQLTDMQPGLTKYCMYPDSFSENDIKEFMVDDEDIFGDCDATESDIY